MTGDETQVAIAAIALIAGAQAELVEKANASPAHTALVLKEIAERCNAITPSKVFYPVDLSDDEGLVKDLADVIGFCDATREEEHSVWSSLVQHRDPPLTWEQHGGHGRGVGLIDGRPVFVSLTFNTVGGHRVCFYHATSTVVDHDMVRAYIEAIAPETAWETPDRLNHTDATNFTNILPREWQTA